MSGDPIQTDLIEFLGSYVTDHKKSLIDEVLNWRTEYISLVLEDVYQPQNASATLRTCECLGVQNIHIIENRNRYELNPGVTLGAGKWVNLHRYKESETDNTTACLQELKGRGYRLIATALDTDNNGVNYAPEDLPLEEGPCAILFGTEEIGLSKQALAMADAYLKIPMFGFTQSYNLSVSVAIVFSELVRRLHSSEIQWSLTAAEKNVLKLQWYRKIVRKHEALERAFHERRGLS